MRLGIDLSLMRCIGNGSPLAAGLPVTLGLKTQWEMADANDMRPNADGSGAAVTQGQQAKWLRDKSGNGYHLTLQTANGPTWQQNVFNGKGCLRFTNTEALGIAAVDTTDGQFGTTIFVVMKKNGASLGLSLAAVFGVTSFGTPGSTWHAVRDNGGFYMMDGSGGNIDATSAIPYDTRGRVVTMRRQQTGTNLTTIRGNSVVDYNSSLASLNIAGGFACIGNWANANGVAADIAAVITYGRVLSDAECSAVEFYLSNKYGIYNAPAIVDNALTWPGSYNPVQQASIYAGGINAHELGSSLDPLKYDWDGEDIDELGTANASLTDQQTIATWKNKGAAAGGGDATQATDANRPIIQKNLSNNMDAVVFGGNADILSVAGSQPDLSFVHNTTLWEIWIVGRKDLASRQVMFSNTDLAAEKGFVLDFDATGKAHIQTTNGAAIIANKTLSVVTPVGDLFIVRAYASSGNNTFISERKSGFAAGGANSNALGAGDATNLAAIGALASTAVGSFDGAMFRILAFNASIPVAQVNALSDYLTSRYGV